MNSRRGASGGFLFARPPAQVTVLEVVEVLDGLVSPAVCTQGECERIEECGPAAVWLEAKEALERVLRETTMADLAERGAPACRARPCTTSSSSDRRTAWRSKTTSPS